MSKIDTSKWKYFEIGRLFTIKRPAARSQSKYDEGTVPFVSSGNYNNGIIGYFSPKKNEILDDGNCITVSPLDGSSFYQKVDFLGRGGAGSAIIILYNNNIDEYNGLFISAVIRRTLTKYSYNDQLSSTVIVNEKIKLPINSNNEPDWAFMSEYIKKISHTTSDMLSSLKKMKKIKQTDICTEKWEDFNITDLFELSLPKGDLQVKNLQDGNVPLITPSNTNNGMLQTISELSKSTLYDANCLTIDMFGNAYFQEESFFVTAHGHVNVLIPKFCISKNIGLFIATSIKSMFIQKYGFSDMCTIKVLKNETIKLPVCSDKTPDWTFMDDYMGLYLEKVQKYLKSLSSLIS